MRTLHKLTPIAAALLLAAAAVAEAGGGVYMGGGGGGRGAFTGGGGGGFGRAMSTAGPGMSAPSASPGLGRGATGGSGRGGGWNGGQSGNWHGNNGNWHGGGHWHGGYYPYYGGWWPYWGLGFGLAATWPFWYDPYYYYPYGAPATTYYYGPPATTYYYGAPSGTIIYRSDQPGVTPVPQGPAIRLYCPATNAFYPDVAECSQQWLRVLPNDGVAPTPQPSNPQSQPQPVPQSQAPAVRPAYPNGSRGYDVTASSGAPRYVRASTTMTASMPVSAGAAIVVGDASFVRTASSAGRTIPAPRMTLPGAAAPVSTVAELRAD